MRLALDLIATGSLHGSFGFSLDRRVFEICLGAPLGCRVGLPGLRCLTRGWSVPAVAGLMAVLCAAMAMLLPSPHRTDPGMKKPMSRRETMAKVTRRTTMSLRMHRVLGFRRSGATVAAHDGRLGHL
jgi:hypothetical protein